MRTIFLLLFFPWLAVGCSRSSPPPPPPAAQTYWCPMHPEVTSANPNAECDQCGGMKLLPKDDQPAPATAAPPPSRTDGKFHCPMHPTIVADKKGSCPICGMDLVPIGQPDASHDDQPGSVPGLATISIAPEVRQRMGLTIGTIEKRALTREVRTSARIVADETRQYRVTTKIEGWVEKLHVNVTGQEVSKGDPLLTIYSPELVSAQHEYLLAAGNEQLRQATRRRLELWDVSAAQIAQLEKDGKVKKHLALYASAAGVVLEKNILAGQKIMPGDSLLVVADLTSVWADADIYPSDLPYVKMGMPVTVTVASQTVTGQVSFVSPALDPATRTVRARLEIPNPDRFLKPEMYATARLAYALGETLAIPESAVMRTGERTYAFKDGGDGKLIPVEIKIGPRSGDYFQLLEGLAAGDRVVTSANFLVDSESSLKAALAAMGGHTH